MQPEAPQSAAPRPEQLPLPPFSGGERAPSLPPLETSIEKGADRVEQVAEARASAADAATVGLATAQTVVVEPVQAVANDTSTPVIAADQDVIEKEWVDSAKDIIAKTKDDPHGRTLQVNQLQRDYLKKRYGKVLGAEN